jgi:arylsulfatase A-like enzyme
VVFTNAFSTSAWTAPATASLYTSWYPIRHHVTEGFVANQGRKAAAGGDAVMLNRLPSDAPLLPELLREAGYRTMGLSANINVGPEIGFDRGFDAFERLVTPEASSRKVDAEAMARRLDQLMAGPPWSALGPGPTPPATADAPPAAPAFLYLHLMDPHRPLHRREPWYRPSDDARQDLASAYDSELGFLDRTLARLSREMQWDHDTLLVVLSDHGEELLDRGRHGHGRTLRPEVVRVLMMVSAPCLGLGPGVVEENVSLVDVAPTLLQLIGEAPPARADGRSVIPELLAAPAGAAPAPDRRHGLDRDLLLHVRRLDLGPPIELWGLVHGRWKLTLNPSGRIAPVPGKVSTGPVRPNRIELHDLQADPHETTDRSDDRAQLTAQLMLVLRSFQASACDEPGEPVRIELDDELLQQLRSLGYAGPPDRGPG